MKHFLFLLMGLMFTISVNAQELSVEEQNKATVKKLMESINQKDWADHISIMFEPENFKNFKESHSAFREVFPDYHYHLQMIAAKGDTVYTIGTVTGTHSKPWDLFPTIPATGKKLQWLETGIFVLKEGKMVSGFVLNDRLGIMNQLGYGYKPEVLKP